MAPVASPYIRVNVPHARRIRQAQQLTDPLLAPGQKVRVYLPDAGTLYCGIGLIAQAPARSFIITLMHNMVNNHGTVIFPKGHRFRAPRAQASYWRSTGAVFPADDQDLVTIPALPGHEVAPAAVARALPAPGHYAAPALGAPPLNEGGPVVAPSHAQNGLTVPVAGSTPVEIEGDEWYATDDIMNCQGSCQQQRTRTGTPWQVLGAMVTGAGKKIEGINAFTFTGSLNGSDVIITKPAKYSTAVRTYKGTDKQIASAINVIYGGVEFAPGALVNGRPVSEIMQSPEIIAREKLTARIQAANSGLSEQEARIQAMQSTAPVKAAGGEALSPEMRQRWDKKTEAVKTLHENISRMRSQVTRDLSSDNEKIRLKALIIALIDKTAARVGNGRSSKKGHSGISTLKKNHVRVSNHTVELNYTGKSGVQQEHKFTDSAIAAVLKKAIANSPATAVFTTTDGYHISPQQINNYLKPFGITSKDIRGYAANRLVLQKLADMPAPFTEEDRRQELNTVIKRTAKKIGHSPAVLKAHYLLPAIQTAYVQHGTLPPLQSLAIGGAIHPAAPAEDNTCYSINLGNNTIIAGHQSRAEGEEWLEKYKKAHPGLQAKVFSRGHVKDRLSLSPHVYTHWPAALGGGGAAGIGEVGEYKVVYLDGDALHIKSEMFNGKQQAINYIKTKSPALLTKKIAQQGSHYEWEVLPYGSYQAYKTLSAFQLSAGGHVAARKNSLDAQWKALVNMSAGELQQFYNSPQGKEAGLSRAEAEKEGIGYGRESARWIMRMKKTPVSEWTPTMWEWAQRQVNFIKRMQGVPGPLYDETGAKTRKHTALLIWGHNPAKKSMGGNAAAGPVTIRPLKPKAGANKIRPLASGGTPIVQRKIRPWQR